MGWERRDGVSPCSGDVGNDTFVSIHAVHGYMEETKLTRHKEHDTGGGRGYFTRTADAHDTNDTLVRRSNDTEWEGVFS